MTRDALAAIRATACSRRTGPGGRTESAARATRRGLVDVALCAVMSDAGLRRSEAAALLRADVDRADDGSGRLTIRHSKTDREGEGAVVAITAKAMADVEAIREGASGQAPVFGLRHQQIGRRIKAAALAAGLGEGFSGHSGRVGMARRMTSNGAPLPVVMRQGRWESERMPARRLRICVEGDIRSGGSAEDHAAEWLAALSAQASGVSPLKSDPEFIEGRRMICSFSSRPLRWTGTATIDASMIWPPIAR